MKIRVRVSNYKQFGRLARRLREAAADLPAELGQGIRAEAPATLAKVQTQVRQASFPAETPSPNHRTRTTGLRERLANATTTEPLSAPPGVRFTVAGAGVRPEDPRGGHALARHTDATIGRIRWRHQIFDRDPSDPKSWFNQVGDPWFFVAISPDEPKFRAAVERVMDRTARKILR